MRISNSMAMTSPCLRKSPEFRSSDLWLVATYTRLGRKAEAQLEVAEVYGASPTIQSPARRDGLPRSNMRRTTNTASMGCGWQGVPE